MEACISKGGAEPMIREAGARGSGCCKGTRGCCLTHSITIQFQLLFRDPVTTDGIKLLSLLAAISVFLIKNSGSITQWKIPNSTFWESKGPGQQRGFKASSIVVYHLELATAPSHHVCYHPWISQPCPICFNLCLRGQTQGGCHWWR